MEKISEKNFNLSCDINLFDLTESGEEIWISEEIKKRIENAKTEKLRDNYLKSLTKNSKKLEEFVTTFLEKIFNIGHIKRFSPALNEFLYKNGINNQKRLENFTRKGFIWPKDIQFMPLVEKTKNKHKDSLRFFLENLPKDKKTFNTTDIERFSLSLSGYFYSHNLHNQEKLVEFVGPDFKWPKGLEFKAYKEVVKEKNKNLLKAFLAILLGSGKSIFTKHDIRDFSKGLNSYLYVHDLYNQEKLAEFLGLDFKWPNGLKFKSDKEKKKTLVNENRKLLKSMIELFPNKKSFLSKEVYSFSKDLYQYLYRNNILGNKDNLKDFWGKDINIEILSPKKKTNGENSVLKNKIYHKIHSIFTKVLIKKIMELKAGNKPFNGEREKFSAKEAEILGKIENIKKDEILKKLLQFLKDKEQLIEVESFLEKL